MSSITIETIKQAADRIGPYINRTPLLRFHSLERRLRTPVYLKCENFQLTRSFKVRGAFNALLTLNSRERGVVTCSSGNFAQAISYAASLLNIPATIVMPTNAPKVKIDRTKAFGVTPLLFGIRHEESEAKVREISEQEGKCILSPYNHERVVAGQGTAGLEIVEDLPDVLTYVTPIGGGGLAAGTATAIKGYSKSTDHLEVLTPLEQYCEHEPQLYARQTPSAASDRALVFLLRRNVICARQSCFLNHYRLTAGSLQAHLQ